MASGRESTRRRLFPLEEDHSKSRLCSLCSLCGKKHSQLSWPSSWRSDSAQQLARSLHVDVDSYVHRPCRQDHKASENITANITLIKTCGVLNLEEKDRGLQSFSKKKASPDQQHDLLNFF